MTKADDLYNDMIQKAVAAMARYGVNDPHDPKLSMADYAALHRELDALWPKKKPGPKGRLQEDPVIRWALGQAGKGRRTKAAKKLADEFRAHKMRPMRWQAIRKRYYDLKSCH